MKLEKFYSLRNDFVILGLTGRVGAGCSEIASKLSKPNYINSVKYKKKEDLINPDDIKFDICYNYLYSKNFKKFRVIEYKNVLLFALIFEANTKPKPIEYIIDTITQYGDNYKYGDKDDEVYSNRFGLMEDATFISIIEEFLNNKLDSIIKDIDSKQTSIIEWLRTIKDAKFAKLFTGNFNSFAKEFYRLMNQHSITKRTRFLHDIANNLREVGVCFNKPIKKSDNLNNIYTVAEIINRIIKLIRKKNNNNNKSKIIIDALKNSLELMYFKEKYSGFYMIAVNKREKERIKYIEDKIITEYGDNKQSIEHIKEINHLDEAEYDGRDVNEGKFSSPDIENCIQKSDYHIFHSKDAEINNDKKQNSLDYQLIKLLALISHPGIITPSAIERTMQVAYNAKYNSGCISRQVGAVITDENFFIKSIGWNDVAQHQMSCKLRNVEDFVSNKHTNYYSYYELNGGKFETKDGIKTFKELVKADVEKADLKELNGLNCSFCFKSFQNTYENEKNQVHTRSLHAEENAMMQIAKNGGLGLKGGYLFSTASPCELCSKKAFQLGITKIYYIDPYPGIAREHILKSGVSKDYNPKLFMFQGAVGRTFHKLYEPFISYKDELKILTGLKPSSINK